MARLVAEYVITGIDGGYHHHTHDNPLGFYLGI